MGCFWDPLGPENLRFRSRGSSKSRFSCLASGQQNRAQNESKMSPKSIQKQLPEGQNVAQKRCLISGSILAQILILLGAQKASKRHPKSLQIHPPRPRAAQRPPGTPEASREPFWPHFGPPEAHFRAFQASFSKLARAPPHDRKHCSKSLPKGSFATAAGQMRTTPQAQWSVWGRRPTGDPATEPSGSRGGRERSDLGIPKAL